MDTPIKAVVVSVEYSGHDSEARIESLWGSIEEASRRAEELTVANQEFGDEQHYALDFAAVEGEIVLRV